jgi:hypothetical protein
MDVQSPAAEATKTTLENSVNWLLADKLQDAHTTIVTKKFLTNENVLVYLTSCMVAEANVPRYKVQVFSRVDGGVREVGYQLFGDHRLVKYTNEMIFGTQPGTAAGDTMQDVAETEAQSIVALINGLGSARQTL